MQNLDFVVTLAGGLTAALSLGYLSLRLGLSPIVGYLLAGIVVGPHTPGFVADTHMAEQMAELGVILLMFGVGLHFNVGELLTVKRMALPGAAVQSLVAALLGIGVAKAFGWTWPASIVFGLSISVASTVVLSRVLADHNDLHTPVGHIAIGWLIVQDLFAVLMLVLLPAFFGGQPVELVKIPIILGTAALKIGFLVVVVLVAGGRVVPWLLRHISLSNSRELFTLTILVVALGIAVGSALLFGVSMALGAFLAGMVVGRSDFSVRAATEALPMRDAFAVLFFISVGMLFDPQFIFQSPGIVAAALAVVLFGTPLSTFLVVLARGYPLRVAVQLALSLAQIGEFSFIVAALGKNLGIIPEAASQTLVAVAIVSISLNQVIYRLADPITAWLYRRPKLWHWIGKPDKVNSHVKDLQEASETEKPYKAVVIGYGPVGQTVCRLLKENEIAPTVIELNIDTVRRLREIGMAAVYGDATHRETLKEAGIENSGSLILSSFGMKGSEDVIRLARELNPKILILARSTYVREIPVIQKAGAQVVFSGEGDVALALTEAILRQLGATPEQIDRERDRVRGELTGIPTETTSKDSR